MMIRKSVALIPALLLFLLLINSCSKNAKNPVSFHQDEGSELNFVTIPGGTFQMGDETDDLLTGCRPVHTVTVSSFEMSKYEITNEQYARYLNDAIAANAITATSEIVTGATGEWNGQEYIYLAGYYYGEFPDGSSHLDTDCKITFSEGSFSVKPGYELWPVTWVTWYGAKAFTDHYGIDLPREAEWEYACRWGNHQYHYGTDDGTLDTSKANYWDSGIYHPMYVGSYPSNPFGLHDMSGNVWEWCADWYGAYSSESVTDPTGAYSGSCRVIRGGDWSYHGYFCRSSTRNCYGPGYKDFRRGFRVVRRFSPQNL